VSWSWGPYFSGIESVCSNLASFILALSQLGLQHTVALLVPFSHAFVLFGFSFPDAATVISRRLHGLLFSLGRA